MAAVSPFKKEEKRIGSFSFLLCLHIAPLPIYDESYVAPQQHSNLRLEVKDRILLPEFIYITVRASFLGVMVHTSSRIKSNERRARESMSSLFFIYIYIS